MILKMSITAPFLNAHHNDAPVNTMSKRKGTDYLTSTTTASSSISYADSNDDDEWLDTRQKLKEFRAFSMDDLLVSLNSCVNLQHELQQEQSKVISTSQQVKNQLENRIEMAREACKEESNDVYRMQLSLEQAQSDRQALLDSLDDLDALEHECRERILQYKELASQYVEEMDMVEAERMRQVPRLKKQLSLYATTSGIKWDFHQEHVLAGQVVCIY